MRDRHRLSKFCLRHGRLLPTSAWTVTRRTWLSEQRFECAAEQGPWRDLVARLRCLRGIDTVTALALVAEIGDFGRLRIAEQLMAFVGLVPCEHSSGEHRRQGSITKVGNSHVRRLLVEAAWHARRRPKVGYQLGRRQRGQDAPVVERAWRCQQRLYQLGSGWPAAASLRRRSSSPAPASSRVSSGRSQPTSRSEAERHTRPRLSTSSSGCARPHGEPSRALCGTARR
jgi:hypothetical protein